MTTQAYPIWWDQQLFDDQGNVLAGGKVYTYYAGTLTPAPTWNDLNQPNAHPVVADMDGRIQYKLDPSVVYDIVIKTAAGATVKSRPNVSLPAYLQGAQGATGAAGVQGLTGARGITGPAGMQGITGSAGAQGLTGYWGLTGADGIRGLTGAQGIPGITGPAGPLEPGTAVGGTGIVNNLAYWTTSEQIGAASAAGSMVIDDTQAFNGGGFKLDVRSDLYNAYIYNSVVQPSSGNRIANIVQAAEQPGGGYQSYSRMRTDCGNTGIGAEADISIFTSGAPDFSMISNTSTTIAGLYWYAWNTNPEVSMTHAKALGSDFTIATRVNDILINPGAGSNKLYYGTSKTAGNEVATKSNTGYNHSQGVANTVWTINHNLGIYPVVQARNSTGAVIEGTIQHVSTNQLTITFATSQSGGARCV